MSYTIHTMFAWQSSRTRLFGQKIKFLDSKASFLNVKGLYWVLLIALWSCWQVLEVTNGFFCTVGWSKRNPEWCWKAQVFPGRPEYHFNFPEILINLHQPFQCIFLCVHLALVKPLWCRNSLPGSTTVLHLFSNTHRLTDKQSGVWGKWEIA